MRIRPAVPDDAPAVVALRAHVLPHLVRGVPSTRQMIAQPPRDQHWTAVVAEVDGEIVGWVSAFRNAGTSRPVGEISLLHVHPEHRGRGIGTGLLDTALDHLAPLRLPLLRGRALPETLPFARRRGFTPSREERFSGLDLASLPPLPAAPAGVRLVPLSEIDPRRVYEVEVAASADEPGDVPSDALTYEHWQADTWDNVGLDREASTGAEVDGVLAAISLVERDGARMWTDYTGAVPAYRGRGLATAVKLAALHRAAAGGVTVAYTGNDEANAPMLAINARLGYRPVASQWSCLRETA
ncbi:GNAT family N-acetyltransferase [Micromonospora sp. WMMA1363]|uniref:GNAT family N-acetyltransferase n=1 Tax=Micromonospora sp. WMMA1363 TaxID=3053985 RepID=UPI00259C9FF5|nr:GNAT family N-acetyltransferase [Micromonospora sp. WMMA1363]MDM4720992.1 GNAT family N-acetyltransferase [Micromonospora sp. WMMA1363]